VIQTNITANMEIKEQKLGQHTNKINNKMKPLQNNRVSRRIERCFYAEIVTTKDVKTYNLTTWTTQTPLGVEQKTGANSSVPERQTENICGHLWHRCSSKPRSADNRRAVEEEFEDTKVAIRIRISKTKRQHNCQKKKCIRTNNDLQNIHIQQTIE
jgi:hypothetical protein